MRLTILSSGSSGNALCIESKTACVYVDAGLRKGRLRERWQRVQAMRSVSMASRPRPTAAFLTHEHADHVGGAEDLAAAGLHLYATAGTASGSQLPPRARHAVREIGAGSELSLGELRVLPVSLPHDAADPVAYVFDDGELRLGLITDCGAPTIALARAFADCDALILETNHDRGMLMAGPYPERLKQRIASGHGHLSNAESATLLTDILEASQRTPSLIICAHLSKVNNRPELALRAVRGALGSRATRVLVAEQDSPMAPIEIEKGLPNPAEQLQLVF